MKNARSCVTDCFPILRALLDSKSGMVGRSILLSVGIIIVALVAGVVWKHHDPGNPSPVTENRPATLGAERDSVTRSEPLTASIDRGRPEDQEDAALWKAIQEAFKVERVQPSENPERKERAVARKEFNRIDELVRELREQGLTGNALYETAENRLAETDGPRALALLEGYRALEEELSKSDLDAMSPEERFETIYKARRYAFGDEMANIVFFEEEAYARYKFEEKAILEDSDLTSEERREQVTPFRNALQVELASRGTYVSFADDRQKELESQFYEKFGDVFHSLSAEDRQAAILEMYREELSPEMVTEAEQLLLAKAQEKAEREAYRRKRETVLNDTQMSFEEKQREFSKLSNRYSTGHSSAGSSRH